MKSQFVIGVDIGTTGTKTTVFTTGGLPCASAYQEYICEYPKPLWVEQDAGMLLAATKKTICAAIAKSGIAPDEICSIGFSTQRCCFLFIDKHGKPLKMISWQDSRSNDTVEGLRTQLSEKDFYLTTGLPLSSTWGLPKFLWMREHCPEIWEKTVRIVQLHDYVLKEFGADDYFTPETDASMSGLWNVDQCVWNEDYFKRFSLDHACFPQVKTVGSPIGRISKEIAAETGLPAGLDLFAGIGDQSSASIGSGIIHDGDTIVSMGTGGMMMRCLDRPLRDPAGAFLVTNHGIHGKWQWEGLQKGSAGIYRWFRDEIASLEKQDAERRGLDVYEILNEMIAATPAGAKGLLMLPYFASAGTPRWNSLARGALIGLTFAHSKACMARAFIEGITLEFRDMMESLKKSNLAPKSICIIGGPTKSALWNQIQASIYNMPVHTLLFADASVLGAAMTAAVGAKCFNSIGEAASVMVKTGAIFEPDHEDSKTYDEMYAAYTAAYEGLSKDTYAILARV